MDIFLTNDSLLLNVLIHIRYVGVLNNVIDI